MERYVTGLMRFYARSGTISPLRFNLVWRSGSLSDALNAEAHREAEKQEATLAGFTVTELSVVDNELTAAPSRTLEVADELRRLNEEWMRIDTLLSERGHMMSYANRTNLDHASTNLLRTIAALSADHLDTVLEASS